ncbi:MAG: amino acid permease [Pirellulales bacterium]
MSDIPSSYSATSSDQQPPVADSGLHKSLGPVMLWGLGVGYVISGEYFGWNLGLPAGGAYGLLVAFLLVTVMYVAFVFSYAEMACALPRAGGVFVYAARGLGSGAGFLGGIAQVIEFVFAPPAIAMAIGYYLMAWLQNDGSGWLSERRFAALAYIAFTGLNIWGVRQAAVFELVITVLAVGELLLFAGVAAPHFHLENFTASAALFGWRGVFAALPFAIWLYLAIEGVANAAEEARNPQRDVALGFGSALATLVVLAALVLVTAVGVGGWERIVFLPGDLSVDSDGAITVAAGAKLQNTPLPLALGQIVAPAHPLYSLLVGIGLLGLVASFNGIVLVAGRAIFEMGRVGFLPRAVGHVNRKTRTPVVALLANMVVGLFSIAYLDTAGLITLSALGAVTLYIVAMLAMIALRRREPELPRPYRAPGGLLLPITALVLAAFSLAVMLYLNFNVPEAPGAFQRWLSVWYVLILAAAGGWYAICVHRQTRRPTAHGERPA